MAKQFLLNHEDSVNRQSRPRMLTPARPHNHDVDEVVVTRAGIGVVVAIGAAKSRVAETIVLKFVVRESE